MAIYLDQEQRRLGTKIVIDEHGKAERAPFESVVTDPANTWLRFDRSRDEGDFGKGFQSRSKCADLRPTEYDPTNDK